MNLGEVIGLIGMQDHPSAILYSSSFTRSRELGDQMKAIGAHIEVITNMDEAKRKIEAENVSILIVDVSGFDPAGVNMLNWFNNHAQRKKIHSLGILTSATTMIPKHTYRFNCDNTFTVGETTFDDLSSVLLALYNTGSSMKWHRIATEAYHQAKTALTTRSSEAKAVLLLGEAGVGRDAFAQVAHEKGMRKEHKFVYANCRIIGGMKTMPLKTGRAKVDVERNLRALMAEANGGTLYFHEADLLPKEVQNILAGVIRKNTFCEPGTKKSRKFTGLTIVSVRNSRVNKLTKDLRDVVNPITLRIPPLSECKDDIIVLAKCFLDHFCIKESFPKMQFSDRAKDALVNHTWTGNIRELYAVVTRAAQVSNKKTINRADLNLVDVPDEKNSKRPVSHKSSVMKALREAKGKKARAARILGITRQHLYRWMKKHGIPKDYPNGEDNDD